MQSHQNVEIVAEVMETVAEDKEVQDTVLVNETIQEATPAVATMATLLEDNDLAPEPEEKDNEDDKPVEHWQALEVEEPEAISVSSNEEPKPVKQVDPKTWCGLHDKWLVTCGNVHPMGNTTLKDILDLDNITKVKCPPPLILQWLGGETPVTIIKCYDLCLKVQGSDDQVNLFHQAFTNGTIK